MPNELPQYLKDMYKSLKDEIIKGPENQEIIKQLIDSIELRDLKIIADMVDDKNDTLLIWAASKKLPDICIFLMNYMSLETIFHADSAKHTALCWAEEKGLKDVCDYISNAEQAMSEQGLTGDNSAYNII
ncbi:MAG TPA: ankyrin repeat domain-containing protein [Rickettsia endosymbiont of Omalisus fontisbellaquei]|nr:ankyrin repeat domain-containing protein [Rickettsia endosymbiont of Omalisus fontisbellaquei]